MTHQEFLNALIFLVLTPLISVDRKQNQTKLMNVRAFRLDDLPGDSPHKYLLAPTYLHWSSGPPSSSMVIYNTLHAHALDFPSAEVNTELPSSKLFHFNQERFKKVFPMLHK